MSQVQSKYCIKCLETKPVIDFSKNGATKDKLTCYCKICTRSINKKWRIENTEVIKNRSASYYALNSVEILRKRVISREKDPTLLEKDRIYTAAYTEKHIQHVRTRHALYKKSNREYYRILGQNYSAKKRNTGGVLSKKLPEKLFKLQKGKCACCAKPLGTNYHLDHIMPLALGGSNTDGNIQLLRQHCNLQKNAKHPIDFMQSKGFLL